MKTGIKFDLKLIPSNYAMMDVFIVKVYTKSVHFGYVSIDPYRMLIENISCLIDSSGWKLLATMVKRKFINSKKYHAWAEVAL